jgi:hypothetical protein
MVFLPFPQLTRKFIVHPPNLIYDHPIFNSIGNGKVQRMRLVLWKIARNALLSLTNHLRFCGGLATSEDCERCQHTLGGYPFALQVWQEFHHNSTTITYAETKPERALMNMNKLHHSVISISKNKYFRFIH